MRIRAHIGACAVGFVAWLLIFRLDTPTVWSQTNPHAALSEVAIAGTSATPLPTPAVIDQLLAQHEATVQVLIRAQREFDVTLARTVSNTVAHLDAMSGELAAQREEDLRLIRESNNLTLTVVAGLSGLLLLGVAGQIIFSTRALNRLARVEVSPPGSVIAQLAAAAGGDLGPRFLTSHPEDSATARFEDALKRLENRISELEKLAAQPRAPTAKPTTSVHPMEAQQNRGGHSPRVAVSVGEGEAIVFLPSDVVEAGGRPRSKFLKRLRKLLS